MKHKNKNTGKKKSLVLSVATRAHKANTSTCFYSCKQMRAEIKAILPSGYNARFFPPSQSHHYWQLCCGLNFISVSNAVAWNLAFFLDLLFCKDQYVYDTTVNCHVVISCLPLDPPPPPPHLHPETVTSAIKTKQSRHCSLFSAFRTQQE